MKEKIIENKTCKQCSCDFNITDKDLAFYQKISPKFDEETFEIPSPTFCLECRQQRRLNFKNERNLYRRKCDETEQEIISIFSPVSKNIVMNEAYWNEISQDFLKDGITFTSEGSFSHSFEKLLKKTPQKALFQGVNENCDFNNQLSRSKNCYMCFDNSDLEDVCYTENSAFSKNCLDTTWSLAENSLDNFKSIF